MDTFNEFDDRAFKKWETENITYGYGTGESHIFAAMKTFMELVPAEDDPKGRCYDNRVLEAALTPTVAWLLICLFCRAALIEYGTSPRCGWLTQEGYAMKTYLASRTVDELVNIANAEETYDD